MTQILIGYSKKNKKKLGKSLDIPNKFPNFAPRKHLVLTIKALGIMKKEEIYKNGSKVLTDAEYGKFMGTFEKAEEKCMEIVDDARDTITEFMDALWKKCSATEFVGERFIITNRFGDITFIDKYVDDSNETSLDEIDNESLAMDILADIL